MELTIKQLTQILPFVKKTKVEVYLPLLNKYMPQYGIDSFKRIAAFIAQIGHESGSFNYVCELASGKAYEGRTDLGNIHKGDGVKYKGRGLIQITGRTNYRQISNALQIDFINDPKLLETPEYAVQSACWWWQNRGLNELADKGNFMQITKIINGGYNGLTDREAIYKKAKKVFGI